MVAITFHIDSDSGVASYLQLEQQVKQALRLGVLEVGDKLPTIREVVASLAINPNTVHKAYRDLEREGLVKSRPGQGTFVMKTLAGPSLKNQAVVRRSLDRWLREAYEAGLDEESIVALFTAALRAAAKEVVA
jgi:GntR family transcriptional regulator